MDWVQYFMMKLVSLLVGLFFTITAVAQVHQPYWQRFRVNPSSVSNEEGIRIFAEGIYEIEFNNADYNRFGADLIIANQSSSDFSVGLGAGIRQYDVLDITVTPIFIDIRRTFFPYSSLRPYIEIKGGYGIEAEGLFFEPSAGLLIRDGFYLGWGVSVQKFTNLEVNSSAMTLKMGLKI